MMRGTCFSPVQQREMALHRIIAGLGPESIRAGAGYHRDDTIPGIDPSLPITFGVYNLIDSE